MMTKHFNPSSLFFLLSLALSTIMMMSSSNWVMLWLSMEMNVMSFTPIILSPMNSRALEGAIKYFLMQTVGSVILLASVFMMNSLPMMEISSLTLMTSIALKTAMAPFHYWLPPTMNNLSWMNCIMLTTWQKIGPIAIMSYTMNSWSNQLIMYLVILNSMIGAVGGISQTQMRPLFAYSSIAHMSWMMAAILNSSTLLLMYFSMYCLVSLMTFSPFMKKNKMVLSNFNQSNASSSKFKLAMSLNILSLGGMPPLIGFIPKLVVMFFLVTVSPALTLWLLFMSSLTLFFYLKLVTSIMMNSSKSMELKVTYNFMSMLMFQSTLSILPLLMLTYNSN